MNRLRGRRLPKLRLGEADRARLGCPELLESPIGTMTNREAIALQSIGYPSPRLLAEALRKSGDDTDYRAITALVWLALRRGGVEVEFESLEFSLADFDWVLDPVVEPVEVTTGKAPARAGSTSSPRRNSTSTATSRRKSASRSSTS